MVAAPASCPAMTPIPLCWARQVGYAVECELVKAGGLLPLRLEARGSAALTALLRTRSRHSHPDGEARAALFEVACLRLSLTGRTAQCGHQAC